MIVPAREAMQKNALFVKLLHAKKTELEKTETAAAKAAAEQQQYTETAAEQTSSSGGTSFASMARWFGKSTLPAAATTVQEPRVTAAQSTTALINSFSL